MSKVLIISAHPDDETLGAGGTILKHQKNGDDVNLLIVTEVFESEGFFPIKSQKIEMLL